jgi:osmotically-inducible protein OsmY
MKLIQNPRDLAVRAVLAASVVGLSTLSVSAIAQDRSPQESDQQMADQHLPAGADAATAARVKSALTSDPTFDAKHISVSMEKGSVVLKGVVQDNRELLNATQIATKAAGDHKVINHLTINQNYPNAP